MQLGQRLRQARQEAGLSQRQLCGDVITRNMLSQIENGSARPSMDTLIYLANRLDKPVSYFLEESVSHSEGVQKLRAAYMAGDFAQALELLQKPAEMLSEEQSLLKQLCLLAFAEQEVKLKHKNHARQLLEQAEQEETCYCVPELERLHALLLAQVSNEPVSLPPIEDILQIYAEQALKQGQPDRCIAYLEACEEQKYAKWQLLRAEAAFRQQDYEKAAKHYHQAEEQYPKECYAQLEKCYQALENYKMAYEYACKQR